MSVAFVVFVVFVVLAATVVFVVSITFLVCVAHVESAVVIALVIYSTCTYPTRIVRVGTHASCISILVLPKRGSSAIKFLPATRQWFGRDIYTQSAIPLKLQQVFQHHPPILQIVRLFDRNHYIMHLKTTLTLLVLRALQAATQSPYNSTNTGIPAHSACEYLGSAFPGATFFPNQTDYGTVTSGKLAASSARGSVR